MRGLSKLACASRLERDLHDSPAGSIVLINPGHRCTGRPRLPDGDRDGPSIRREPHPHRGCRARKSTSASSPWFGSRYTDHTSMTFFSRSIAASPTSLGIGQVRPTFVTCPRWWVAHLSGVRRGGRLKGRHPVIRRARHISTRVMCAMFPYPNWPHACGSSLSLGPRVHGEFGLPPHAYLNNLRVRHAKRMIGAGARLPKSPMPWAIAIRATSIEVQEDRGRDPSQYARRTAGGGLRRSLRRSTTRWRYLLGRRSFRRALRGRLLRLYDAHRGRPDGAFRRPLL